MQAARHREGLALALLAMCIFMTIPSAVGSLEGRVDSTSVTVYISLVAVIALWGRNTRAPLREELRRLTARQWLHLLTIGAMVIGYRLAYYHALHTGPRVEVTAINYMWPMLLTLFGAFFLRGMGRSRFVDWIFILLSFVGALVVSVDFRNLGEGLSDPALGFAFLAAVLGALYHVLIQRARSFVAEESRIYLYALAPMMIPLCAAWPALGRPALPSVGDTTVLLYLGLAFGLGQVLWVKGVARYNNLSITSMVYLTPVGSIVFLNLLLGDEISPMAAFGAALIGTANFLMATRRQYPSAAAGTVVTALMVGFLVYLLPVFKTSNLPFVLETNGLIFAIVIGFTLNRLHENKRATDHALIELGEAARNVIVAGGETAREAGRTFLRRVIDRDFSTSPDTRESSLAAVYEALDELKRRVGESERTSVLESAVGHWAANDDDTGPKWEGIVLTMFATILIVGLLAQRDGTVAADLMVVLVSAGVAYLMFTVLAYHLRVVSYSETAVRLRVRICERNGFRPYLPARMIDDENLIRLHRPLEVVTERADGDRAVTLSPPPTLHGVLFGAVSAIVMAVVVFLICSD